MIEYRLQAGQFAVIVILDEKITMEIAKKAARFRAAEVALIGGFHYFLVQSETQIQVVKQKADAADVEEMIITVILPTGKSNHLGPFPPCAWSFNVLRKNPKARPSRPAIGSIAQPHTIEFLC